MMAAFILPAVNVAKTQSSSRVHLGPASPMQACLKHLVLLMLAVELLKTCRAARSEVRNAHGVKIYFDPVSTAARQVTAKKLAASVLEDSARQVSCS